MRHLRVFLCICEYVLLCQVSLLHFNCRLYEFTKSQPRFFMLCYYISVWKCWNMCNMGAASVNGCFGLDVSLLCILIFGKVFSCSIFAYYATKKLLDCFARISMHNNECILFCSLFYVLWFYRWICAYAWSGLIIFITLTLIYISLVHFFIMISKPIFFTLLGFAIFISASLLAHVYDDLPEFFVFVILMFLINALLIETLKRSRNKVLPSSASATSNSFVAR